MRFGAARHQRARRKSDKKQPTLTNPKVPRLDSGETKCAISSAEAMESRPGLRVQARMCDARQDKSCFGQQPNLARPRSGDRGMR